jgi:eukaryotic-like serine/threonine-protein kinase
VANGQTIFGRYRLIKRIAVGGMAEIYSAIEHGLEGVRRKVVVKRVLPERLESPEFVAMFLDEARVASMLSHPNIAHIYNFGEVDGVYFLAMEYVEGLTVSKLIQRSKPSGIPLEVTLRIVSDICAGLHHAHELADETGRPLGVVHRDVSPGNVMVSTSGVAKVIDFGVARAASQIHSTGVDQLKGKLGYMAPEYLRREPIDRRMDVFAVGAVLFELVTGEPLFKRESHGATVASVLTDAPPSVAGAGVPAMIDDIIGKAVQKDPAKRYATALEMQREIEQLMARRGMVVTPFTVGELVNGFYRETTDGHSRELLDANMAQTTPSAFKRAVAAAGEPTKKSFPPTQLPSHHVEIDDEPEAGLAGPPTEAEAEPALREPKSGVTPDPASDVSDPFQTASRRRLALWVALPLLGLVLVGAGLAMGLMLRPASRAGGDGAASVAARVSREAGPDAARPAPEAALREAGAAATPEAGPAGPDAAAPGRDAAVADARPAPAEPPPEPRPPAERRAMGKLFLHTNPWSKVSIGSRSLGTTPLFDVALPAGSHVLRLVDRDGKVHTHRVRIEPNQPTKVFLNLNQPD